MIRVRGAYEHNLKHIDLDLPRGALTVFTGVSGSGKSSLVVNTIAAEAQRQFLNTLTTVARSMMPTVAPVSVSSVTGLSPALIVDQRALPRNPRSTVGTVTEAYSHLRLIYSRLGGANLDAGAFSFNTPAGACEACRGLGVIPEPAIDRLIEFDKSLSQGAIRHQRWKINSRYWNILVATEYFDIDLPLREYPSDKLDLLLHAKPERHESRPTGYIQSFAFEGIFSRLLKRLADKRGQAGRQYDLTFFDSQPCHSCHGSRLNSAAANVRLDGKHLGQVTSMEMADLLAFLVPLKSGPTGEAVAAAMRICENMTALGLGHLTLNRSTSTLSGGEAQRLRFARHLTSPLVELIYVFDEPTAGLHARDRSTLSGHLRELSERSNTVIVIEHSLDIIRGADLVVELGPGGGAAGGDIIAKCTPEELSHKRTPTGKALRRVPETLASWEPPDESAATLQVFNARRNNLRNLDLTIPRAAFVCITGVSGSGKSSLMQELAATYPEAIQVTQGPPGKSRRSNVLTYVGVFTRVRSLFASSNGVPASLFTFNGSGACPACKGLGEIEMDMHFLGTVTHRCEVCNGSRFSELSLRHEYRGCTIADVLAMTVEQALLFFDDDQQIAQALQLLCRVGLGYVIAGQPLHTLSGGESQRLKLVKHLKQKSDIVLLDEPSRGLHPADLARLVAVFRDLSQLGSSVIVVEHDLDLIAMCDWVVDLGPEAGDAGGRILVEGSPAVIARTEASHTGRALRAYYEEPRKRQQRKP